MKPHPPSLCWWWGSLFWAFFVMTPPPFRQPGYLPLEKGGPWALRPRLAAGLPLSRRRSARAHVKHATNSEASDTYARWTLLPRTGFLERRWGEVRRIT